ncbi:MAG: hypothetical protein E6767_19080 [Dysgonomonas sp.]|nr:hypothetical protein [Dysgonomonas sp.]
MKIKINADFSKFDKIAKDDEYLSKLFISFSEYLEDNTFFYQKCPRLYDYVDVEDILREWADKTYKESANSIFNKLFRVLETDLEVRQICHSREYISIYCTDNPNQE